MRYDKGGITGKGIAKDRPHPYKSGGGPRDQQRRLRQIDHSEENGLVNDIKVKELGIQIEDLAKALHTKPRAITGFSPEDVDEEIRKAVAGAVKETEVRFEKKINKLTSANIELRETVNKLKNELSSVSDRTDFDLKESVMDYEKKISNLESKIRNRDKIIDDLKDEESNKIEELTQKIESLTMTVAASSDTVIEQDSDRPKMEDVFIDPIEGMDDELESHVNIEDAPPINKFDMDEKVDKLKGLMKKLPNFKK